MKKILSCLQYVPANEIWPTANPHVDEGQKDGLLRGYCIEVTASDGRTDWLSCEYVYEGPEELINDEFHTWYHKEHNWKPTGRICFRGYGIPEYSVEEREHLVRPCDSAGKQLPRDQW